MSGPFIIMSKSRIKPGKAQPYAQWCEKFFTDVEEAEPRLLAFNIWESDDRGSSVVIQVHPDAESFEYHLKLFGDRVRETSDYIDLEAVEVYGAPSPFVHDFVQHGLDVAITVHPLHKAGFTRLGA